MSIVDEQGNVVASYQYDPYGNVISATGDLAETNPLRYRGYYYDAETRLYYLQSRYYDPELGRFINADAYASTGQGILGNNMFAYCMNSPINGYDPCGTCIHRWDFWNDCEKCGGKSIEEKLANNRGTFSYGFTASVSTGIWVFGIQLTKNLDQKGNVEYQYTPYGGISTGTPQIDISGIAMITNAPDTEALQGMGYSVGASAALGASAGVDGVIIPSASGEETYFGGAISYGAGAGADVHVTWGETKSILGYNIFDVLERLLRRK